MDENEKNKKLISIFILAIVITVILLVCGLIYTWSNKDEKKSEESEEFEVGKYSTSSDVAEEDIVKSYFSYLSSSLMNGSTSTIYAKLNDSYKSIQNIDESSLYFKLNSLGLVNSILTLNTYEKYSLKGYSNVFVLNVSGENSINATDIIILEKSPNNYEIAFDGFLYSNLEYNKIATLDNIELNIMEVQKYESKYVVKIKITNKSAEKVILNYNEEYEAIKLVKSDETLVSPSTPTFIGRSDELAEGESRTYEIEYVLPYMKCDEVISILLKGVHFNSKNKTVDLNFEI